MHAKTFATAVGALLLSGVSVAQADSAPQNSAPLNEVRAGVYWVQFHVDATDITGPYVPPGVGISVNDVTTAYLAYVRTLSTHFNLELAIGWPPLTETVGRGPATLGSVPYNGQVISTARWFAPTLLFNYVFGDEKSKWRPYVGAGINYTRFYSRQSTEAGNAASGGPTQISLPASVGPAVTAGLGYHPSEHWGFYASYSISQVSTKLTADTAGVIRTSHINFWPHALVVSAGYSF
jgi:outer membrane protein